MHQCIDIVVDNGHSQDAADAQEKHDSILTMFCQLIFMNPAGHATFSVSQYMMSSHRQGCQH